MMPIRALAFVSDKRTDKVQGRLCQEASSPVVGMIGVNASSAAFPSP